MVRTLVTDVHGRLLAGLVDEMARRRDPALADWIARSCALSVGVSPVRALTT